MPSFAHCYFRTVQQGCEPLRGGVVVLQCHTPTVKSSRPRGG